MSEDRQPVNQEICEGCMQEIDFCHCGSTIRWRPATAQELLDIGWTEAEIFGEEEVDG